MTLFEFIWLHLELETGHFGGGMRANEGGTGHSPFA